MANKQNFFPISGKGYKPLFPLLISILIILTVSFLTTAVSCGSLGSGNNNSDGNSGGDGNGGGGGNSGGDGNGNDKTCLSSGPGSIVITPIDGVATTNGNCIVLKASGFPTVAVSANVDEDPFIALLLRSPANSFTKAFDITIMGTSAEDKDKPPTGGLLLVDVGSKAEGAFTLDPVGKAPADYDKTRRREGIVNVHPYHFMDLGGTNPFLKGWQFFGMFASKDTPNNNPNASPFSFSKWTEDGVTTKPFLFCRTSFPEIIGYANNSIKDSTLLKGGHKAECFVASMGAPFTGEIADAWLRKAAAGATDFKSKFNIATLGIRTDDKTIAELGLDKKKDADDIPLATAADDFREGLGAKDMKALIDGNPSAYQKFSVSIVKDDGFNYVPPKLKIHNFE